MALPHPRVGVGVIVQRDDNKILLGQRKGSLGAGERALPGGHLEHGESFEACAAREVLEETGVVVSDCFFATAENTVFVDSNKHYVTIFVLATAPGDAQPQLLEPDKCFGWEWVEWSQLKQPQYQPLFQPLRQLVERGYVPRKVCN